MRAEIVENRLLLARDRFGICPLYYVTDGARVHFCSEIKPLVQCLDRAWKVDVGAIDQYFSLGNIVAPRTLVAGLLAVPPGCAVRFDADGHETVRYWRYGDYAGIGPGAHGRRLGMRTLRHRKPENFLSALRRNGHGLAEEAPLSAVEAADEALVMGLRLREGIDADALARRFGLDRVVDWQRVGRLVRSGHLKSDGSRIALTRQGRLVLDAILGEIAVAAPLTSEVAEPTLELPAPQPALQPVAAC